MCSSDLRWSAEEDVRVTAEADELAHGHMHAQLARLWPPGSAKPTEQQLQQLSARYLADNDPRALAAIRRSNRDQVVTDAALAAVNVPTLGIVGTKDPYVPSFRELATIMPDMRLVLIDGATHNAAPARPEFLQAVLEFLAAHGAGT